MAVSSAKLRTLYIMKMLLEKTDEKYTMSSADINKVKEYFDAKNMLSARGKLHAELKRFIEEQKAESD